MASSLIEAKYVVLTLTIKKNTEMGLLLTKVDLLDKKNQYTELKLAQESKGVEQIMTNTGG